MGEARRSLLELASLWTLLATICAHALSPAPSNFARSPGSAFSYHTAEVSIGPKRVVPVAKAKDYQEQDSGSSPAVGAAVHLSGIRSKPSTSRQQQFWFRADAPLTRISALRQSHAPRAPPAVLIQV